MDTIIIRTQAEFDNLPDSFEDLTKIQIIEATIAKIEFNPENSFFVLESSMIQEMRNSSTVQQMLGSSTVQKMLDSSIIQKMSDSSIVQEMWCSSMIQKMRNSSVVQEMRNSSTIQRIFDSSTVQRMFDSSTVQRMFDSSIIQEMQNSSMIQRMFDLSTVQRMFDSSTVREMRDSSIVQKMLNSSTVQRMFGSSTVIYMSMNTMIAKIYSNLVKIIEARQQAIIIYRSCNGKPEKKDITVQIIKTEKLDWDLENFIKAYNIKRKSKQSKKLILYKFVQNDYTDFFSGKIKYEVGKTTIVPDWNANPNVECGNGLHLSTSIKHCKRFNNSKDGHALQCEVSITDIVIHPNPMYPQKIRCKKCFVVKEIKC